jgi:hypothetical protein
MSDASVLIHVRFSPEGSVTEIGERPGAALPQQWFNFLSEKVGDSFQPLSGGRGVFRVVRGAVDDFKAAFASSGTPTPGAGAPVANSGAAAGG